MVFIINFKIKKLILTKPDQYTTCVLNKHMTKPCLHYNYCEFSLVTDVTTGIQILVTIYEYLLEALLTNKF